MTAAAIARLKITLDDVKPQVVRRIEVPLAIRLARLHLALQAAIGWTDTHLYELRANDVGWGVPDPGSGGGPLDARKARLVDVLEDLGTKTLRYLYDFGDGWEHPIKIERIDVALTGTLYPRLLEGTGHCPPEDVGGPWGYKEFLAATPTRSTNVMPSSPSGWNPQHSTLSPSTSTPWLTPCRTSPNSGRESRTSSASVPPKPRPSAEGYRQPATGAVPESPKSSCCGAAWG